MGKYAGLLLALIFAILVSCAPLRSVLVTEPAEIVIFEDFESGTYDKWEIEGTAFGKQPHTGTSPKQNLVTGFLGKGLVNTYLPNDEPQGKMKSEKFKIQRPFIGFLIGGGKHPDETCINLVIDGEIVRTQTGRRSEKLRPAVWDVKEFIGKEAFFEIVDKHSEGWGHINIDHIVFSQDYPPEEIFLSYTPMLKAGKFEKIYDPSVGEKEQWYINDHTFVCGQAGLWHLIGITHAEPANPLNEKNFAHAVSSSLTAKTWSKLPFALTAEWEKWREVHLWAPHIISHNNLYHMFYCAGDRDHARYKIHLATSKDLHEWQRHPENPMVVDGYDARDPFILKLGDTFVMYYTATDPADSGNHIVAFRTSKDLIHWSERGICFRDPEVGKWGGGTESPFVIRRGEYFYLFIGPRGGYVGTEVFRSKNPFEWDLFDLVGHIESHALEVIRDIDGKWYVSSCGWGQGGVYLAPLTWLDGLDDSDTSFPIPVVNNK